MDAVESDADFEFVEVVDIPSGGSAEVARSDFLHRHPEFSEKLDWLRIDRVCGRDGISALRFWVQKSPPTEPARRELPYRSTCRTRTGEGGA
jgi:hypothetical protein